MVENEEQGEQNGKEVNTEQIIEAEVVEVEVIPVEAEEDKSVLVLNEIENSPENDSDEEDEDGEKKKLKTKHIYRSWKRASKSTTASGPMPIDLDLE